jgi:ribosomal protein S18 acetylase RimI-like enzyme
VLDHAGGSLKDSEQIGAIHMLDIRPYLDADKDAVWRLHNEALAGTGAHAGNGAWDSDLHEIPKYYIHAGGLFLVGVLEIRIVAMGAVKRLDSITGEIKRMRVSPDCQRRGYGSALLATLEQQGRNLGITRFVLDTTDIQVAAQGLYENHGYRETGTGKLGRFNVIYYEKILPPDTVLPP